MYAIVDIETTGNYASGNRITEIAIRVFDGLTLVEKFDSLVDPCCPIPSFIQTLTGITPELVINAPRFRDIADQVYNMLKDRVFVAHNVGFDHTFVRSMLAEEGYHLNVKKLCTVRLSKKILPGRPSYKLGLLCNGLGIINEARHRAGGDADATVELFRQLLCQDTDQYIYRSLKDHPGASRFPPNVPIEQYQALPECPGVYYFKDQAGRVLYVGKAKNIRSRVNGHFSSGFTTRQKAMFLSRIHSFSFERCGTELMAQILEDHEIKRLWPEMNRSQKQKQERFGLYSFEDQNGYLRLAVEKYKPHASPLCTFFDLTSGLNSLVKIMNAHNLCPRLCYIQQDQSDCHSYLAGKCKGACRREEPAAEYNTRVNGALTYLEDGPSFAIFGTGLEDAQRSLVLVLKGKVIGMGYIDEAQVEVSKPESLKKCITALNESSYTRQLVYKNALARESSVKYF